MSYKIILKNYSEEEKEKKISMTISEFMSWAENFVKPLKKESYKKKSKKAYRVIHKLSTSYPQVIHKNPIEDIS